MSGVMLWGWDTANWRKVLVDAAGHLQVDVLSSALPTGAATAANQVITHGYIDGLEGLLGAGLPVAFDTGALKVREQNWPADPATGGRQDVQTDVMSLIRILLNARLPITLDAGHLRVREQNWPADYPLPAAQVATLQQVTEQGTPSVHLYGFDTANWQYLQVEAAALHNLRVRLYSGGVAIHAPALNAESIAQTYYGLWGATALHTYRSAVTAYPRVYGCGSLGDAQALDVAIPVGVWGYNGASWDRLRVDASKNLKVATQFGGNIYSKTMTMTDDNATRFEVAAKKLRDVVIIVKTHPMLLGETGVEVYPVGANETIGFTKVDISTLYFKNAGAGNNGVITILGVEE